MRIKSGQIHRRIITNGLFKFGLIFISSLCAIPLILILYFIVKQGISSINWQFLTNLPRPVGETGGGILNAIVGTFMLVLVASIMAIPVGVLGGVYISENKNQPLAKAARFCAELLQGVPSIVIGIIAYLWIVRTMGHFSAISGSIALAFMMLPVIIRTTEETFNLIPVQIKEASLALGVPYYKTILKILLPTGLSGIVTGVIISVARVAGETAPLLFTAFGNPYLNFNMEAPMQSLPLIIFNYATSPYEDWKVQAWGASFVLLVLILMTNIILKFLTRRWKIQF